MKCHPFMEVVIHVFIFWSNFVCGFLPRQRHLSYYPSVIFSHDDDPTSGQQCRDKEFIDETTTVDYDDNEFSLAIENLQQQCHRRDFLAWNSLFAGIFSGCIFPRGQPIPPSDAYPPFSRMSDYASPPGEGGVPFQRPFSTVRRYKSITLFNGIKVLLVSDKNARVSSAAMTIRGAGQFSDPPFLSGLAHLMEHITLSSIVQSQLQKGDFEEWLQSDYADGLSNGFTAYEKVCL